MMTALLILCVAGLLAAGYYEVLARADGETLQGFGLLIFVPWLILLVGTVVALVLWS
jgi:hypothetical protein